jgi:hypothetical protein
MPLYPSCLQEVYQARFLPLCSWPSLAHAIVYAAHRSPADGGGGEAVTAPCAPIRDVAGVFCLRLRVDSATSVRVAGSTRKPPWAEGSWASRDQGLSIQRTAYLPHELRRRKWLLNKWEAPIDSGLMRGGLFGEA